MVSAELAHLIDDVIGRHPGWATDPPRLSRLPLGAAATPAQGWRIDEALTSIGFTIDAVGFPTTRGHFAHYRGRLLIDFDRPAKSYTTFTVDAASVDVGSPSFNDFVLTVDVATDPAAKGRGAVAFVAKGRIQRSDFGMMFGIPLIDDALEITVKTRALSDE